MAHLRHFAERLEELKQFILSTCEGQVAQKQPPRLKDIVFGLIFWRRLLWHLKNQVKTRASHEGRGPTLEDPSISSSNWAKPFSTVSDMPSDVFIRRFNQSMSEVGSSPGEISRGPLSSPVGSGWTTIVEETASPSRHEGPFFERGCITCMNSSS